MEETSTYGADGWIRRISQAMSSTASTRQSVLRLFIAGDKSQVGKSSCCLGIISSLLDVGFKPEEIAYIKPATQCEKVQIISEFCADKGIDAVGIGPVVFYSGFTREFLNGNLKSSSEMLKEIQTAVDDLCNARINRKIVIIDGVGFPAVGSIVGISNADVARALRAPVLLVCPEGVGNAVDSFNLNEAYFAHHGCKVLGAVFNRLATEGYYSLDNCKSAILSYFTQYRSEMHVYGFIPEAPPGSNMREFILAEFRKRFDTDRLLRDLRNGDRDLPPLEKTKRKLNGTQEVPAMKRKPLSRAEIQSQALAQGATAS